MVAAAALPTGSHPTLHAPTFPSPSQRPPWAGTRASFYRLVTRLREACSTCPSWGSGRGSAEAHSLLGPSSRRV